MKKILIIIIMFWTLSDISLAHKEWVHQYIVRQAYSFLQYQVGDITKMQMHLGNGTARFPTVQSFYCARGSASTGPTACGTWALLSGEIRR